jgi:hypothetical protein
VSKSHILKALKILRLEEILKLTTAIKAKSGLLKKAAGQELISWDDASTVEVSQQQAIPAQGPQQKSADVLPFVRPVDSPNQKTAESPLTPQDIDHDQNLAVVSSDFMLWQRELSKDVNTPLQNKQAVKGYAKSTEMYEVKTITPEGKDKIRFASTQGVLVNKKQA